MDTENLSLEQLESRLRERLSRLREGQTGSGLADKLISLARSMQAPSVAEATETSPAPTELPVSDSTIRAAIAHTFTIGSADVQPSDRAFDHITPEGELEQRALLANSTTVLINGRQRLMLTDSARARLLDKVHTTERYSRLLREAASKDAREFSEVGADDERLPAAWLRSFLTGDHGLLERAPARELRAAVEALERLQLVTFTTPPRPNLEAARRLREFAELLEPLRILIGQRGGWERTDVTDRFAGREAELAKLRGFVDELKSRTVSESVQRFISRNIRRVRTMFEGQDEAVFFIEARGGLGKSTLVAKFMLDHALSQERPFSFAYLDFDRGALRPRDPRSLLAEVARQVQLQMPSLVPDLEALCQRLRQEIAGDLPTAFANPFDEFRGIVQKYITLGSRPFLIVMDTMEVVQYDPDSLAGILDFLTSLYGSPDTQEFTELKIVAAGRADIPELRTNPEERNEDRLIVLEALSVDEARDMAMRLGKSLLPDEWQEEWARDVAGKKTDPPERREPLTLRVAVELLRDTPKEERASLARQIGKAGEEASEYFVGKLYERRILSHIRNDEVRALAWPGLIFRRVTPDLIRHPLAALCSPNPEGVPDLVARAEELFNALASEVWMVESFGPQTVRHRPDLRARTLPLMRRHDREKFLRVNEAAIKYFRERKSDPAAHAEWIYHRLLAGENCEVVDLDWIPPLASLLAGASDDFDRKSEQRSYLLSRTATGLLPPAQLAQLPTRLALDHVARTAPQLGAFDDTRIEPVLLDLADRIGEAGASTTSGHPIRAVLLVKTGRWNLRALFEEASGEWAAHAAFAEAFKRARTTFATGGDAEGGFEPESFAHGVFWDDRRLMPIRTPIQYLAHMRLTSGAAGAKHLDSALAGLLERVRHPTPPSDIAALRTGVVFGSESSRAAARVWLDSRRRATPVSVPSLSLAELRAVMGAGKQVRKVLRSELEIVLEKLGVTWAGLLQVVRDASAQPMRIPHADMGKVTLSVVEAMLRDESPDAVRHLRSFFAARDEDWLVPMAYAAARTKGAAARAPALNRRMESHVEFFDRRGLLNARRKRAWNPKDPLSVLRVADEAADLLGVARIYAEHDAPSRRGESDIGRLLVYYTDWRARIERLLDGEDVQGSAEDQPPKPLPVRHTDDIQKDRWGGVSEREGRRLEARLGEVTAHDFDVDLIVRSTDGSTLEGPVIFHLHDTFPRSRITIRSVREEEGMSSATLAEVNSFGVFTAAAQVRTRSGAWTSLELDLKKLAGLPQRFVSR